MAFSSKFQPAPHPGCRKINTSATGYSTLIILISNKKVYPTIAPYLVPPQILKHELRFIGD
jgi:hypothetical protein